MKKTVNDWLHDSPALCHFNRNHYGPGPKGGQFAPSSGGSKGSRRMSFSDRLYDIVLKRDEKKWRKQLEAEAKKAGVSVEQYSAIGNDSKMQRLNKEFEKVTADNLHRIIDDAEYEKKTSEIQKKMDARTNEILSEMKKNNGFTDAELKELDEMEELEKKELDEMEEVTPKESLSKNVIPESDFNAFKKDHKLKSMQGDIDIRTNGEIVGRSSTKTWKTEVRTKKGVHLIESMPTTMTFKDVTISDGKGIDRQKLKDLDSFSISKESNKAIYAGRDLVASTWKSGPGKDKTNWAPMDITFGYDKNNKPTIKGATYFNKKDPATDSGFMWVSFNDKLEPEKPEMF